DFANCPGLSAVTFTASVGKTYHVAVDGAGSASYGYFALRLRYCAGGDCFAPKLFIDSYPMGLSNDTPPSLSFHATDANPPVTFHCEFGGWPDPSSGSGPCSSPYDFGGGGLTDGYHWVVVTATDAVGNETGEFTYTFSIDTVAPVTVIDSAPS